MGDVAAGQHANLQSRNEIGFQQTAHLLLVGLEYQAGGEGKAGIEWFVHHQKTGKGARRPSDLTVNGY
jgi:hypothetical protein